MKDGRRPTDAELGILRVLWRIGPATVRRIHGDLRAEHETGYTTILKLLQIMHEKGLVVRDESERAHVYEAAVQKEEVQGRLVTELLERVFSGSAESLVLRVLSTEKTSTEEIARIRALLDELEGADR